LLEEVMVGLSEVVRPWKGFKEQMLLVKETKAVFAVQDVSVRDRTFACVANVMCFRSV
jgi:hypothetical protein